MGLFSKKRKITVDDMALQIMIESTDVVDKLQCFNDVDDAQSMAFNMGYYYGFLKLHLNSITGLNTANTIIDKSITNLENATKGTESFADIGAKVRAMTNSAMGNIKYAMKELKENPFMGLAILYLKDLYNSTEIDISKVDIVEKNMRLLYGMTSNLTKDTRIVK